MCSLCCKVIIIVIEIAYIGYVMSYVDGDTPVVVKIMFTAGPACFADLTARLRPISLLRLSLLRFLDSNFPEKSTWAWESHPLNLRFCLSQTL